MLAHKHTSTHLEHLCALPRDASASREASLLWWQLCEEISCRGVRVRSMRRHSTDDATYSDEAILSSSLIDIGEGVARAEGDGGGVCGDGPVASSRVASSRGAASTLASITDFLLSATVLQAHVHESCRRAGHCAHCTVAGGLYLTQPEQAYQPCCVAISCTRHPDAETHHHFTAIYEVGLCTTHTHLRWKQQIIMSSQVALASGLVHQMNALGGVRRRVAGLVLCKSLHFSVVQGGHISLRSDAHR